MANYMRKTGVEGKIIEQYEVNLLDESGLLGTTNGIPESEAWEYRDSLFDSLVKSLKGDVYQLESDVRLIALGTIEITATHRGKKVITHLNADHLFAFLKLDS